MGKDSCSCRIRWSYRHLPPFFLFRYSSNGGGTATDKRSKGHDHRSPRHVCLQAYRDHPNLATPRSALRHASHGRQAAQFPRSRRLCGGWNTGGNCTPVYPMSNCPHRCRSDNSLDALAVRRQPFSRASMNEINCACLQVQFFLVVDDQGSLRDSLNENQ